MPYTLILFVTRRPGLTSSAFKFHWETIHIPLLKSIVGEDFPLSYTRHYMHDESDPAHPSNIYYGTQEGFTFDAVAVFTFADRAHLQRFKGKCHDADAEKKLKEDDERFQDVSKLKGFHVADTKSTGRDGGDMGWRFVGSV